MQITSTNNKQITTSTINQQESNANSKSILQSSRFLEDLTNSKFNENIKGYLQADASGNVHEEQLQFAIVNTMLTTKSIKIGDEFTKYFAKASASNNSIEDNVKIALKNLVSSGSITEQEAQSINGISFRAAQLDSNLEALYDNKGSNNDPTIAISSMEEALSKAATVIDSYRKGNEEFVTRPLSIPSNSNTYPSSISTNNNSESTPVNSNTLASTEVSQSRGGFLWKPVSESNGKLVVLLPTTLTGKIRSVAIYSDLPPTESNLLEDGKFSSVANGNRAHFRFSKPGSNFPDNSYVVAQLDNGSYTSFQIGESSARNN